MTGSPADQEEVRALLRAYLDAVGLIELPRLRLQHATGLTIPQFRILRHLREQPRTQSELVQSVGLSPAGMSRVVDRLQERGLVSTRRRDEDRRSVEVQITEQGWRLLGDITLLGHTSVHQAVEAMTSEQRARITHALRELVAEVQVLAVEVEPTDVRLT